MKKLALGSLMLAALVSQATGCIITSDDDPEAAFITADWSFRNIGTNTTTGCPSGFGTVALHNQEIDIDNRPIGLAIVDLFDCIDARHESAPLDPVVYETWLEVTSGGGALLYAESLPQIIDVTLDDKPFNTEILNDGGYFQFAWNLRGAQTNAPLQCRDVARLDGIEIISTVTGGSAFEVSQFDCEDGFDISKGLLQGSYTVSIDAFEAGGPALGPPVNLANRTIARQNDVTDLGTVNLLIDGL